MDDLRHTPMFGWGRLRGLLEVFYPRRPKLPSGPKDAAPGAADAQRPG
jgi:hypothetical protein